MAGAQLWDAVLQRPPPRVPVDQLTLDLGPAVTEAATPADGLSDRFTFDSFVVGRSNRLAHNAALCVAENVSAPYNPLFIHGASGNGKTHLLNAIGLYVREHSPQLSVRYVRAENFTSEVVNGARHRDLDDFKRRYRRCSVLLLDDVQVLEGKEATQEELFHAFNDAIAAGARLVMAADRHPGEIRVLADSLRSRLKSGLVADLQAPELATRVAILRSKAAANATDVPDDVIEMIASRVSRNVRELESALIRVLAVASIERLPITLETATAAVDGYLGRSGKPVTLQAIIEEAAAEFGFSVDELCGASRTRSLVKARHAAMYVCRSLTSESLPAIARKFGGRDHSTVLHAFRKVEREMLQKNAVYEMVVALTNRLGQEPPRP